MQITDSPHFLWMEGMLARLPDGRRARLIDACDVPWEGATTEWVVALWNNRRIYCTRLRLDHATPVLTDHATQGCLQQLLVDARRLGCPGAALAAALLEVPLTAERA